MNLSSNSLYSLYISPSKSLICMAGMNAGVNTACACVTLCGKLTPMAEGILEIRM